MHVSNYSPFERGISDLTVEDLAVLKEVEEGWYVDYKREAIKAEHIAKGLAAFANTYGGWLFFGVEEAKGQGNPVAASFPGLSLDEAQKLSQQCRQGAAAHLSESPYFESVVLSGPCDSIGLSADRAVFILYIPQSLQAPHIHKNGSIYRRVSSGSEPVKENDRHIINQMMNRRDAADSSIKELIDNRVTFSKNESELPFIRVLIDVDPELRVSNVPHVNKLDILNKLKKNSKNRFLPCAPLDSFIHGMYSINARQAFNNNKVSETLSMTVSTNLFCEIILPVNRIDVADSIKRSLYKKHYDNYNIFKQILQDNDSYTGSKIADLNYIYLTLMSCINKYRDIMDIAGWSSEIYAKVEAFNIWRVIPFLDTKYYIRLLEDYGIPYSRRDSAILPPGKTADSFMQLPKIDAGKLSEDEPDLEMLTRYSQVSSDSLTLFNLICNMFGIPSHFEVDEIFKDIDDIDSYAQLTKVTLRAVNVNGPPGAD